MLTSKILLLTLLTTGIASRYDPGVFHTVALNRNLPTDTRHIALLDCSRVGDRVLVCHKDECVTAQVTDCAGIADGGRDWMLRNNIAGELDYDTALHLDCVGQPITVYTYELQEGYQYE